MKEERNDYEISKRFVNEIWDNAIKAAEEKQAIKVQQNVGDDNIDVGEEVVEELKKAAIDLAIDGVDKISKASVEYPTFKDTDKKIASLKEYIPEFASAIKKDLEVIKNDSLTTKDQNIIKSPENTNLGKESKKILENYKDNFEYKANKFSEDLGLSH